MQRDDITALIAQRRAETVETGKLDLWTVFRSPKDQPGKYVARRFVLDQPTQDAFTSGSLVGIRAPFLRVGFTRLERARSDEPQILETWL